MTDAAVRVRELETLNAVHDALNRDPSFDRALQTALEQLVGLVGVRSGWVFTTTRREGDVHASDFRMAASAGLPPALAADDEDALRCGRCECQGLFSRGKLDRGINMVTCSRLADAPGDRGGLEIHASVPLLSPSGPVGILNLAAPGERRFDPQTLAFLAAVGKAIGTAFERDRLQDDRLQEARWTAVLEERQRVAREMHDALSQLLFAADLSVGAARQNPDADASRQALDDAASILADAQGELRSLIEVMRVPDVSGGLEAALRRLAQRTGASADAHLHATGADGVRLDPVVAQGLYRIAQEAVHNALRHAEASHVRIRLRVEPRHVVLEVADDGVGFDPTGPTGLGIPGMRERAVEIGGRLDVESGRGKGTRIRVRVDLAPDDATTRAEGSEPDRASPGGSRP